MHFRRDVYKGGGQKAAARLEYITSKPEQAYSAAGRQLDYVRQADREDLVDEGSRNLPAWAEGNPYAYFQAAELYEQRKDAKVERQWTAFEEWKITLPHELSREQNQALIDDLLKTIAGNRLPYTYAFHDPLTMDGTQHQPHMHLIISARMNDEHARTAETHFKRWNAKAPHKGGAQKDPAFWHKGAVYAHRLMISDVLNVHLELSGHGAWVHPDTLESRGIEREPEPKLLPSESAKYRDEGKVSPTMAEVLAIREARAQQPPREQNNAWTYWRERKDSLGITREMSREEKVGRIAVLRHGTRLPTPQRSQPRQQVTEVRAEDLTKRWKTPIIGNRVSKIYHLPTHKNYGDVGPQNQVRFGTEQAAITAGYRRARNEVGVGAATPQMAQERSRARTRGLQGPRSPRQHRETPSDGRSIEQQMQELLARMDALDDGEGGGRGLRVRLHDEEERARRQDHGMGW